MLSDRSNVIWSFPQERFALLSNRRVTFGFKNVFHFPVLSFKIMEFACSRDHVHCQTRGRVLIACRLGPTSVRVGSDSHSFNAYSFFGKPDANNPRRREPCWCGVGSKPASFNMVACRQIQGGNRIAVDRRGRNFRSSDNRVNPGQAFVVHGPFQDQSMVVQPVTVVREAKTIVLEARPASSRAIRI